MRSLLALKLTEGSPNTLRQLQDTRQRREWARATPWLLWSEMLHHLITTIFSKLDSSDHLLVDKICAYLIHCRIVPRREDLFPKEQPPWCVHLLSSVLFSVLFTLWNGIHHVITSTTETRHLQQVQASKYGKVVSWQEKTFCFVSYPKMIWNETNTIIFSYCEVFQNCPVKRVEITKALSTQLPFATGNFRKCKPEFPVEWKAPYVFGSKSLFSQLFFFLYIHSLIIQTIIQRFESFPLSFYFTGNRCSASWFN